MPSCALLGRISRKAVVGSSRWISKKAFDKSSNQPNVLGGGAAGISTLPSKASPWLMLPPAVEGGHNVYNFYSLGVNQIVSFKTVGRGRVGEIVLPEEQEQVVIVGSSHGWLALFNERTSSLFLSDPLTGRRINLPPIHNLPTNRVYLTDRRQWVSKVSKVILSCSPDDKEEECRALMKFGPDDSLASCLPGRTAEWTPLFRWGPLRYEQERDTERFYQDFVYSRTHKLFYCLTTQGEFEAWNLGGPWFPRMTRRVDMLKVMWNKKSLEEMLEEQRQHMCEKYYCFVNNSLVLSEQTDELYYVRRFTAIQMRPDGSPVHVDERNEDGNDRLPYKTIHFSVHKFDKDRETLKYMDQSLDGLSFFVGNNHSFALSAQEFPELMPNSIYFTDVSGLTGPDGSYGGHDVGIFHYESRKVLPCYYPCDVQSIKRIAPAPVWLTPTWPH